MTGADYPTTQMSQRPIGLSNHYQIATDAITETMMTVAW